MAPQGELDQTRVCKTHHNLFDHHISFVLHVWKEKQVETGFTEPHSKTEPLEALNPISATICLYSSQVGKEMEWGVQNAGY